MTKAAAGAGGEQALVRSAGQTAVGEVLPRDAGGVPPGDFKTTARDLKEAAAHVPLKNRKGGRGAGGDFYFDYMSGEQVMDLLDEVAPQWQFRLTQPLAFRDTSAGLCITAVGSLTIDGVTREGVGVGIQQGGCPLETAIKKADTDSLKRAAAKFGVAVARVKAYAGVAYDNGEGVQVQQPSANARAARVNPKAQGTDDLLTEKQFKAIVAVARAIGETRETIEAGLGCKIEEMSRRAASTLIDTLKARQQQQSTTEE